MRKLFLDELPKINGNNNRINWKKCVGYKIRFIYDDIDDWIEIIDYKYSKEKTSSKLKLKYNGIETEMSIITFKKCNFAFIVGKKNPNFKIEIGTIFKDDKRDLVIIDREYRFIDSIKKKSGKHYKSKLKYYKYKCNICGYNQGWIPESNLLSNTKRQGCSCCCGKDIVLGINTIYDTDKWMIPYVGEEFAKTHTSNSHEYIYPTCPDCGKVKTVKTCVLNIYRNHSIGCNCSDKISYPEKFMYSILNQLNLDFKTSVTNISLNWCENYRYDFSFILHDELFIIETHGLQHYESGFESYNKKGKKHAKTLKEQQENDKLKKELALNNGVKEQNYIVIDCRNSNLEWIKDKILKSRLNVVFNLNNIDWFKAHELACKNLIKIICEIKNNNPELTTTEIGEMTKFVKSTIWKWLKMGNKIWCNYDAETEMSKARLKSKNGKPLKIFKNGDLLGVFDSVIDLSKKSEELYGVKLLQSCISNVCIGKSKNHKGYTFEYID